MPLNKETKPNHLREHIVKMGVLLMYLSPTLFLGLRYQILHLYSDGMSELAEQ